MRLTLLRVALIPFIAFAGGCSLLVSGQTECTDDSACAEGAVCVEGLCVRPLPPWADGGYTIDAGVEVSDASEPDDASVEVDAGEHNDAGADTDGGETLDASEPVDGGEETDAGEVPDAGEPPDAGGETDAGIPPPVCPAVPDCSLPECFGAVCAPAAQCNAAGKCVRNGCELSQPGGQSACDSASCLGASCGAGVGTCTAVGVCSHRLKAGCQVDISTGYAACGAAACKGASCGEDAVCTASECIACGTECGSALPGCTNGIDCHTGDCAATCQCLGTPSDFWCAGNCVDLTSNNEHCGTCAHACESGSSCASGCCGDPSDCSFTLTALCPTSGYECVEENGSGRARETACRDNEDNDGDGLVDCADADCDDQACGTGVCADGVCCSTACAGGCEVCAAALGASADGTCTLLPNGAERDGCGSYRCDGTSGECPTSCTSSGECSGAFICSGSACLVGSGDPCSAPEQCASGSCNSGSCL